MSTDPEGSPPHFGAQPYPALISEISATFNNCPPSVAEAELLRDPALVYDILDYRNARMVMDLVKREDSGAQILAKNPDMLKIMDKLAMSQRSFEEWREWQRSS